MASDLKDVCVRFGVSSHGEEEEEEEQVGEDCEWTWVVFRIE